MKHLHGLLLTASILSSPAAAMPIAIDHVTMIDGSGSAPIPDATILFEDGHILAAGRDVTVPPNARRLDYRGRTVMPGLISDHSHVGSVLGTSSVVAARCARGF